MLAMRPELNAKNKIKALERRKALLDALIEFIQTHPNVSSDFVIQPLHSKTGMLFLGVALIRPLWARDKVVLRLEKYPDDWLERYPEGSDPEDASKRTVCEDVSHMPEHELELIIDKLHRELVPEDFEEEA